MLRQTENLPDKDLRLLTNELKKYANERLGINLPIDDPTARKTPTTPQENTRRQHKKQFENALDKTKNLNDGRSFQPETVQDYRKTIHLLDEEKVEFYTYQLTAEKPFGVVIRGIPAEINTTDIKNDLEEKGFQINSIIRITVGKEKRTIPLIHVSIKKTPEASDI
ncbi:hypothetical protein ILUMI_13285 [Ignelater luminosus]|uniref:Pre-C2HC domain-containing protein n=1 Tax=Ignelater luminosus TaxID=2038154 RepID=A0A8K0GB16_IGNLU|nr:hypothetical protein ILUMI_13285 [Ignelater luminosus]